MSSKLNPNITKTASIETIAELEIEAGNPSQTSIWLPINHKKIVAEKYR